MICPDCSTPMDYITTMCTEQGDVLCDGYYKCPMCKIEIDKNDCE